MEGSLVEFKSRGSTSMTWMTSNVTRLSVVSRTRLLTAAASVANALAEFLPPLKLLQDRSALILARPRSNWVTFDVIHVTEVDARDLNSTRLPSVLARFFVPRRGKPGDEARV